MVLCILIICMAGTMQMPPKWALGYQQCRWSYETADRVLEVFFPDYSYIYIYISLMPLALL